MSVEELVVSVLAGGAGLTRLSIGIAIKGLGTKAQINQVLYKLQREGKVTKSDTIPPIWKKRQPPPAILVDDDEECLELVIKNLSKVVFVTSYASDEEVKIVIDMARVAKIGSKVFVVSSSELVAEAANILRAEGIDVVIVTKGWEELRLSFD